MKTLNELLTDACEKYIKSIKRDITIDEIADMCSLSISDVIWRALRRVETLKSPKEVIINGVKQSDAEKFLNEIGATLINKVVGTHLNSLKMLMRDAKTYGYKFSYGVKDKLYDEVKHNEDCVDLIKGYKLEKIKK